MQLRSAHGSFVKHMLCLCLAYAGDASSLRAADFYWVGGTGKWNDYASHWATSPGGIAFYSQPPSPSDNVYFNAASFLSGGDTVYIDSAEVYCQDMDWSGVSNSPALANDDGLPYASIKVYGSVTLGTNMSWCLVGDLSFTASGVFTISTSEKKLSGILLPNASYSHTDFIFSNPGGEWTLADTLKCSDITLSGGKFITGGHTIQCGIFEIFSSSTSSMYLGVSDIYCQSWIVDGYPAMLDADSAYIKCSTSFSDTLGFNTYNDVIFTSTGSLEVSHCIVHNVSFTGTGTISGSNNSFNEIAFNADGNILSGSNVFHRVIFSNTAGVSGNNSFDSLLFMNPGYLIQLGASDTQTVSDYLFATGSQGFSIAMQSSSAGTQSVLSKSSGSVCMDYVDMQDIHVAGGASFYAGGNSTNINNNSGWIWSGCTPPLTNVWPGDANYDKIADNKDILYIGIAYNASGPARTAASNSWTAQQSADWGSQFTNGVNMKHADCDGTGTVDQADTTAVSLNYGQTHLKNSFSETYSGTPELYFEVPPGVVAAATVVSVPVKMGTPASPVADIYGAAFSVNYDPSLVQGGVSVDYTGSWLTPAFNLVHLEKDFSSSGKIDIGLSRIDHTNISGNGLAATLLFTVTGNGVLKLSISSVLAIDKDGNPVSLQAVEDSIQISGTYESAFTGKEISFYPNPASEYLFIKTALLQVQQLGIEDITGRAIALPQTFHNGEFTVDVRHLDAGLYFLKIKTNKGELSRRFLIAK